MARIDYVDHDIRAGAGYAAFVERIRRRRGGALRPLDRLLLHSPPLAEGWNGLLGAVRSATTLADDVREFVILRIAVLNDAPYEWDAHEPIGRAAGLAHADFDVLRGERPGSVVEPRLAAVLAYTDAMTADVRVPESVFCRIRRYFDDRQIVELTVTIGAYNLVSRFLVALDVRTDDRGVSS